MKTNPNQHLNASCTAPIPADDKNAIDGFIAKNKGKKIVVVQGLGFVGAVMALVCANTPFAEYAVLGVDLPTPDSWLKIKAMNEGVFPLTASDPKITELFESSRHRGNFYATFDPYAYSVADVVIVDVNLDVQKEGDGQDSLNNFSVDMSPFKRAIETIGRNCRLDTLVVVETTVPPGTCKQIIMPILHSCLCARGLPVDQIRLGHSYERVMPGPNYVESIREFPRVYSGFDNESAKATREFLETIIDQRKCTLTPLKDPTASEMAKVLENSYRSVNIAFMVEWSRFAEEAGVDIFSVINAIRQRPTHANLMFPGIGVGGYCLTKDPLLASWARTTLLNGSEGLEYSENAVRTNDQMPYQAFAFLQARLGSLAGKRVLLLGVAYRGDVGDTRFSPVGPFYDKLVDSGADVVFHDPCVPTWQEKSIQSRPTVAIALNEGVDVVVVSASHSEYCTTATMNALLACRPCMIFDTLGLYSQSQLNLLEKKHKVMVLGRGDL